MEGESAGAKLRAAMSRGAVVAAGAFNPFVARLVEEAGFGAVYVSGAAVSNALALPDEGIVSRAQVLRQSREIVRAVRAPVIVDVDTGFGGPQGTAETVRRFEAAGIAAVQIEDQDPRYKRCGHLEGKRLISAARMAAKIRAAAASKRDAGFVIIARTDARAVEGFDAAVARARAYLKAGADAVFPEALLSREEFAAFRKKVPGLIVANMTEFGKTPWISDAEFGELGYAIVLHPATTFRLAAQTIRAGLREMRTHGNQAPLVEAGKLMPRGEIDEYLVR
jgi:methylisocitrate lyase